MSAAADGIQWMPESRFCALLQIPRSTLQSRDSEDLLVRPETGAFTETHVVEALLVDRLRAFLPVATTRNAMRRLRADGTLSEATDRFRELRAGDRLDIVIDTDIGEVHLCLDDAALLLAVRDDRHTRTLVVAPLADDVRRAIKGFRNGAEVGSPPVKRARGRRPSTGRSATVESIEKRRGEA